MNNYSIFEYLYRDADNFKVFGEILLLGRVTDDNEDEIRSLLAYEEVFVAEQVGLPVLYPQLWKFSNGPTRADHAFHEFVKLREASETEFESMSLWGSFDALLDRFKDVEHEWNVTLSVHCKVS